MAASSTTIMRPKRAIDSAPAAALLAATVGLWAYDLTVLFFALVS